MSVGHLNISVAPLELGGVMAMNLSALAREVELRIMTNVALLVVTVLRRDMRTVLLMY